MTEETSSLRSLRTLWTVSCRGICSRMTETAWVRAQEAERQPALGTEGRERRRVWRPTLHEDVRQVAGGVDDLAVQRQRLVDEAELEPHRAQVAARAVEVGLCAQVKKRQPEDRRQKVAKCFGRTSIFSCRRPAVDRSSE